MSRNIALAFAWVLSVANVAGATAAYDWTFNNDGTTSYMLTSVSSSTLYTGTLPAANPTINLLVGKRYSVTVVNSSSHPFQVIAKGATPESDVVLLSMGATVGSFESNADVAWTDNGAETNGVVEFTLTTALFNEMQRPDHIPGYRCGIHTSTMRGDFVRVFGPAFTTQPVSQTVNAGDAVTFTVVATGTPELSYQWKRDGAAILGATGPAYTLAPVQWWHAGSYRCHVSNVVGPVASNAAVLTVNFAPQITTQPVSQTVNLGSAVNFQVIAIGTPPLSYQWQHNSASIPSATGASYAIAEVEDDDAGDYVCVVSNAIGSAPSDAAALAINGPPEIVTAPLSQTVASGSSVTFTVGATGTAPLSYQWRKDDVPISGATDLSYAIAQAQVADAGGYDCVVSNAAGNIASPPAVLVVYLAPEITAQPASQTVDAGSPVTFQVGAAGTEPLSYQWKKDGVDVPNATTATLNIPSARLSDAGAYVCVVSNPVGAATSGSATLTVTGPPEITVQPVARTINAGGAVTFSVAAVGSGTLSYEWRKNGGAISGATSTVFTIAAVQESDAGSYACMVSNESGSTLSNAAVLTVLTAPAITTQPVSQTVGAGASVTFLVAATGSPPLSYQWQKNSANIAGVTLATYAISAAQSGDAGTYRCIVSNTARSATSNDASLAVGTPPTISQQPVSLTVNAGAAASFTVAASGTAPLSYQWQHDGTDVPGATAAAYALASVQAADAGAYRCVVGNLVGTATSNSATLTVQCVPPGAPTGVVASDGTYPDKIQVTWTAVTGATAYKVFRGTSSDASNRTLLATVDTPATTYADSTASPPTTTSSGCSGGSQITFQYYYYWVKAVNTCAESDFSALDQGYRGAAKSKTVAEAVLPAASLDGDIRIAHPDSALFIRLRADEPIAPETISATITSASGVAHTVQWLPVVEGDDRDGWVCFFPESPWTLGDLVTMTATAETVSGVILGPLTYQFQIEPNEPAKESISQPGSADQLQIHELGDGQTYALDPDVVYDSPQYVWMSVPANRDPASLRLYYYVQSGLDTGWFPAEDVAGWLVPDTYRIVEVDGTQYIEFAVRHGGIFELATPPDTSSPESQQASGDALILACAVVSLLLVRKTGKR